MEIHVLAHIMNKSKDDKDQNQVFRDPKRIDKIARTLLDTDRDAAAVRLQTKEGSGEENTENEAGVQKKRRKKEKEENSKES